MPTATCLTAGVLIFETGLFSSQDTRSWARSAISVLGDFGLCTIRSRDDRSKVPVGLIVSFRRLYERGSVR